MSRPASCRIQTIYASVSDGAFNNALAKAIVDGGRVVSSGCSDGHYFAIISHETY